MNPPLRTKPHLLILQSTVLIRVEDDSRLVELVGGDACGLGVVLVEVEGKQGEEEDDFVRLSLLLGRLLSYFEGSWGKRSESRL